MNKKIKNITYILLSAGIAIFLYILLHEFGHMVVMLSAGATITSFSIFTAHVSAVGGDYKFIEYVYECERCVVSVDYFLLLLFAVQKG